MDCSEAGRGARDGALESGAIGTGQVRVTLDFVYYYRGKVLPMEYSIPGSEQTTRLCRQILEYLAKHPNARDTAGGITQWWLTGIDGFNATETDVQAALNRLVSRGWVGVARTSGATAVFGLVHFRWPEAEDYLRCSDTRRRRDPP
jgi:hypothetical protein